MDQTESSALSRDDNARDTDRAPTFASPWAGALLAIAFRCGSLTKAADDTGVTLAQVYHLRNRDPSFAAALRDFEAHRHQLILARIEDAAASGDLRAIKVLTRERSALLAMVTDNANTPGRDGVPPSIASAALHSYYERRDQLMAQLKGTTPPPSRAELNGAVVCGNCQTPLGPWHASPEVRADLTTYFTAVLSAAWRYCKLTHQRPEWTKILPDPDPSEVPVLDYRHVPIRPNALTNRTSIP